MHRFLKSERLLKRTDFCAVRNSGKKRSSRNLFIEWKDSEKRRIGITVGRRVGKANVRNRIKRVAREFFRLNKELFPVADITITARPGSAVLTNEEIREELRGLLSRI